MGWFSNMVFGKTTNQVEAPKPKEHNVWGIDKQEVPNVAEQTVETPTHDRVAPELQFIRIEPHLSSDAQQLDLWVCVQNNFDGEIEITRVDALGQSTSPSRYLKYGQNHEIQVYKGAVPQSDAEHKVVVTYRSLTSGDYYLAKYLIKYKCTQHEAGDHYMPYALDLAGPIKRM